MMGVTAMRAQGGRERDAMQRFRLDDGHTYVGEAYCPVCLAQFVAGDDVVVVPLGPGVNPDDRAAAKRGDWYSCMGIIAHADCAGVE